MINFYLAKIILYKLKLLHNFFKKLQYSHFIKILNKKSASLI